MDCTIYDPFEFYVDCEEYGVCNLGTRPAGSGLFNPAEDILPNG